MAKVDKNGPPSEHRPDLGPCWLWKNGLCGGYGRVKVGEKTTGAHRRSYELLVGPIPEGLRIDHLCRVKHCVNPAHLECVTVRENTRRGLRGEMLTHCKKGHLYDEKNTKWSKGRYHRVCRACANEAQARYVERRRAAVQSLLDDGTITAKSVLPEGDKK